MHPTLENPHLVTCQQIIHALNECHVNSGWKKYLGACNDLKHKLNDCLTEDYVQRRAVNAAEAKARREKAKQVWSDLELK
ncbi:Respiratory chain complex assembly or maintenance protein [Blastocladiella emersonii ATCC 22665]|nr:Respiratory chain complex assembly or maintenance protein [Blastocladiella emersonii ATCC 22665]